MSADEIRPRAYARHILALETKQQRQAALAEVPNTCGN